MCWNLWKCFLLILLLGGDLSHSPASLEAHLPRVSPQYDRTNILFAPKSFYLLDYRHPYSAMTTIFGMLVVMMVVVRRHQSLARVSRKIRLASG